MAPRVAAQEVARQATESGGARAGSGNGDRARDSLRRRNDTLPPSPTPRLSVSEHGVVFVWPLLRSPTPGHNTGARGGQQPKQDDEAKV